MSNVQPFTRADLVKAKTKLLRDGRYANACVTMVEWEGKTWTVKDFSSRSWWVRKFVAPLFLRHELSILKKLSGIDGVASDAFLIDNEAMAIEFLPGRSLGKVDPSEITTQFLEDMETLMKALHGRGIVHLDTRGTGNWLVSPDGKPMLIDFQASLTTGWMPAGLRRFVELVDISGVYKKWVQWQPETMGEARMKAWEEGQEARRRWKFRGYFGIKKKPGDNIYGE